MASTVDPKRSEPQVGEYEQKLKNEQDQYRDVSCIHDLPPIFHYWSNKYVRPLVAEFGFTLAEELYAKYLALSATTCPSNTPVFLSLGAGNCDTEVRVAQLLREAGCSRFLVECLDLNPVLLGRGRDLANDAGLENQFIFVEGDFNKWEPTTQYSGIIANQSLHHVLELEQLFDRIKESLRPNGYFVTSDMIGRNGHLRWPEALREVQRFWRELPVEYRWNRALDRHEEQYMNYDCSAESFEGIRAQDILPLLLDRFDFHLFIPFGNVINVFVDRAFGYNFNPEREWDRDFIDRVHVFDEQAILDGTLTPTQMFAVMTREPCSEHHYSRGLKPANCVRKATMLHSDEASTKLGSLGRRLVIGTTSLRPATEEGVEYQQQLETTGGTPAYIWSATQLPPDLKISSAGLLSGKLRASGVFTPTISVTDNSSPRQAVFQRYTICVKETQVPPPLVITSPAQLPSGIAQADHLQQLFATGGEPPYTWSVVTGTPPSGLDLNPSTGVISGKPAVPGISAFAVQVVDCTSESTVSDLVLTVDPAQEQNRLILPHVTSGSGWKTHLYLINASPSRISVTVRFRSDDGSALTLSLAVNAAARSVESRASTIAEMIAPYSALHVETTDQHVAERAGWAEVLCTGPVAGYGAFDYLSSTGVTTDLVSVFQPSFLLPYNNTDGCKVGVALVNADESAPASIVATMWDDDWTPLGVQQLNLPPSGHASFLLADKFPVTAAKCGFIEFRTACDGKISGLGLRFDPGGHFVSIPKLPRAGRG